MEQWQVDREKVRRVIIRVRGQSYAVFRNVILGGVAYYTAGGQVGESINELRGIVRAVYGGK